MDEYEGVDGRYYPGKTLICSLSRLKRIAHVQECCGTLRYEEDKGCLSRFAWGFKTVDAVNISCLTILAWIVG